MYDYYKNKNNSLFCLYANEWSIATLPWKQQPYQDYYW